MIGSQDLPAQRSFRRLEWEGDLLEAYPQQESLGGHFSGFQGVIYVLYVTPFPTKVKEGRTQTGSHRWVSRVSIKENYFI